MRTTKKEITQPIREHILNSINAEGYEQQPKTEKEKLQFVVDTFNAEYVYPQNLQRYGTYQELFKQWLMGLPTALQVEFTYHKVNEFMESIGLKQPENKSDDETFHLYLDLIYREFNALLRKHNIDLIS